MKEVHITANSWIPIGAASACIGFIVASVLWAAQIEAKAEKALDYQAKYETAVERRLERIEQKLDKVLEK